MAKKKSITISDIIVYKLYSALGRICKVLFAVFAPKKLDASREVSDMNLLFFSGEKGGKMLKPVLLSVYKTWEKIPFITIGTDGTPAEYFKEIMAFWPFPYKVRTWKEYAEIHVSRGGSNLAEFGEVNLMARKALAMLAEAQDRPTVYCDTDVLWFAEPRLPAYISPESFQCRMSGDIAPFYHMPLIRYFKEQGMLERPALNAGVMYMSGSIYAHYPDFIKTMEFIKIFHEPFAEQTLFALIGDKLGDRWSLEEIILDPTDVHWPLLPKYLSSGKQFARHHVATKNSWFWRDALYILLFKKPGPAKERDAGRNAGKEILSAKKQFS